MVRRSFNWTYHDVTDFLKEHDFSLYESQEGSVELWLKLTDKGEPDRIVEVKFTRGVYTPRALKKVIRQSGIPEEAWVKWANS